ncbi:MAG: hypothetical protein HZA53_09395 [Planctomycetes bacterium]|nr:hypothetical protein [Planctomycetota bacterium]
MRTLFRGLILGVLCSLLRAPRGLDLFQLPAASGGAALGWRALALVVVGFGLWSALRRPGFALLASTAAGYALHGLVLAAWIRPESSFALAVVSAIGLAAVVAAALDERRPDDEPEPAHEGRSAFVGEMLGLFAAGAGAALSIEAVARHVRAFGDGLAQDDTVFGFAFLLLAALGALGLGWIARVKALRNLSAPFGLAAAATAGFLALVLLNALAPTLALERYVRAFGLGLSEHGTFAFDLLVGAALFVAPALLLGFAIAGLRTPRQSAAVLFGAAQGLMLVRSVLGAPPAATELREAFSAAQLVQIGAFTAVAGAALAVLSAAGARKGPRYLALCGVFVLVLVPLSRETLPQPIRAPWDDSNPLAPRLFQISFDLPEGLVTVESRGPTPPIATLNGHALTSALEDAVGEIARVQAAFACVPEARRAKGALAVLLVGQLDPLRATMLRQQGAARVDRTAAWHAGMQRIEAKLFDTKPLPEGEVLDPAEARARIDAGKYDLVLVLPVASDAAAAAELDAPASTVVVDWRTTNTPIAHAELGKDVLVAVDGLESLCIARTLHAERGAGPTAPHLARAGRPSPAPTPWSSLARAESFRFRERTLWSRALILDRLHRAAAGTPDEPLFAGLLELARAQERSSPFESPEQQYELGDACLDALSRHAESAPLDAFSRGVWEGLARILVGKRDVERMRRYLEPIARRHAPWPALEKALARADLEALEPESAVKRLATVEVLAKTDFDYWNLLGDARKAAKDLRGATEAWRRASELRPGHQLLERKLAVALVRLGDPKGRELVEKLLQANPKDAGLQPFLGPGPWPEDDPPAPR